MQGSVRIGARWEPTKLQDEVDHEGESKLGDYRRYLSSKTVETRDDADDYGHNWARGPEFCTRVHWRDTALQQKHRTFEQLMLEDTRIID